MSPYADNVFLNHPMDNEFRPMRDAIGRVCDWLQASSRRGGIPSANSIRDRFQRFRTDLPDILLQAETKQDDLSFLDVANICLEWLRANAR